MKHHSDRIDDIFKQEAQNHRVDVNGELWNRLEVKLDRRKPYLNIQNLWKIAAVLIPALIVTFLLVDASQDDLPQVTDLSDQVNDEYYDNYRDFIQSQQYSDLLNTYSQYE